jgi:hypothetical protein
MAIDDMMVDKNLRLQALSLLSSFVRLQPPHLHLVLETSLIGHLHTCLLLDNSTTVVDLALTILIMFIPHITTTLVADLPRLFLIYARILCWDKYNNESAVRASQSEASESEYGSDVEPKQAMHFNPTWDVIEANIDSSQSLRPKADYLFTFLYGLFPLNFMNFVRKPRRYLKMKSYPRAEDLDMNQNLIRSRTEAHRTQHKLHPNFFMTTAEDELIDNRWLKSDPADLVSECLGLCIAISASLSDRDPGPPPTAKLPALPRKARSVASRIFTTAGDDERLSIHTQDFRPLSNRTTLSTTMTGTTANFPDPVRTLPRQSSQMSLTETTKSPRDSSPLTRILGGDSKNDSPIDTRPQTPRFDHMRFPTSAPPSPPRSVVNSSSLPKVPSLQSFAQALSRFPIPHCSAPGSDGYNTAVLQREVMLLKNDLNFERYQKQKYIEQIGNLQRKHMSDVTVETDTQNLMNQNRSLQSRLVKSDERYEQLKKEMAASRTQAKRFEDQLTARLKSYREDEKKWHSEIQTLKHSLAMSKVESEDLQAIVIDTERRERDSRNQMGTLEFNFDDIGKLRSKVAELETKLREYEQRDLEYQRAREEHNTLLAELQTTRMKLTALDQEREQMHNQFEQKIQTLEANERNSSIVGSAHSSSLPGSIQQMIDSALAAQQNKFTQLKRNYTKLHHKFQEIETRNQELEGVTNNNGRQSVLSLTRFADDSSIKGGVDRQSSFGSGSASGSISHSRSARRHDFAPSGSSNDAMQLNFDDQQSHMHRPHTQGAIISRTSSGGLAANATNPLPRGHESRDMGATFEQAFSNDFTSPTSPTDNLADSLQFGGGAQGKPMLEIRSYGRGKNSIYIHYFQSNICS